MRNQDFRSGPLGLGFHRKKPATMPSHLDRWKASVQEHRASMDRSRVTTACARGNN